MTAFELVPLRGSQKSKVKSQKSKVKSQKSKVLFLLALTFYKWVLYFRRDVLVYCPLDPMGAQAQQKQMTSVILQREGNNTELIAQLCAA